MKSESCIFWAKILKGYLVCFKGLYAVGLISSFLSLITTWEASRSLTIYFPSWSSVPLFLSWEELLLHLVPQLRHPRRDRNSTTVPYPHPWRTKVSLSPPSFLFFTSPRVSDTKQTGLPACDLHVALPLGDSGYEQVCVCLLPVSLL